MDKDCKVYESTKLAANTSGHLVGVKSLGVRSMHVCDIVSDIVLGTSILLNKMSWLVLRAVSVVLPSSLLSLDFLLQ